MRRAFSAWVENEARKNDKLLMLTGDLGFNALENVSQVLNEKFINVGVCEQNMISMGAGLAHDGWDVLCYSIAPFAVFRPAEQIRLDLCIHNKNVKIVGNGGGYGYGIMGATHHALEDLAVLTSFSPLKCFIPRSVEDVPGACQEMMKHKGPAYLRLNAGSEKDLGSLQNFASTRMLFSNCAKAEITIVGLGPMAVSARQALGDLKTPVKIFSVCELPLPQLTTELKAALHEAELVWVIEEHVARGGLGEHLCWHMTQSGIAPKKFKHSFANGYPSGMYGSQSYHQSLSGLTPMLMRDFLGNWKP